jgi:hypothetical protein
MSHDKRSNPGSAIEIGFIHKRYSNVSWINTSGILSDAKISIRMGLGAWDWWRQARFALGSDMA